MLILRKKKQENTKHQKINLKNYQKGAKGITLIALAISTKCLRYV